MNDSSLSKLEPELKHTLLDLSDKIIMARRELDELLTSKNEYISAREIETRKRVDAVLKAAENALSEAGKSKSVIREYVITVEEFTKELLQMREKFLKEREEDQVRQIATNEQLKTKEAELETLAHQLQAGRSAITAETENLKRVRESLEALEKHIESRNATVTAAWEEAKSKGII